MGQRASTWFGMSEPQHIYDVLKYNELLCSILGINIYRFVGNPVIGVAKVSAIKIINFAMLNVLLVVVAVIHAGVPYNLLNNGSIIVMYGIRTLLVGGMFGTCGIVTIHALNWQSVVRVLQDIHEVDLKFQIMKHPVDFATHRKHIVLGSGLCLFLHQTVLFSHNLNNWMHIEDRRVSLQMVFGQFYFNTIYFAIICLFFAFSYVVSFRFVHLNQILKLRFDTSNGDRNRSLLGETSYRGGTVEERISMVQRLAGVYHQLTEITARMNRQFADVLALNVVIVLLFSAFNIFALFKVYGSNDVRTRMFSVFNLSGGLFYTMMYLLIVGLAQMVLKESKLTGVLLHKAMNNESNRSLIRSMMLFSRQVRNRSAYIGSRQIVIDWPFIFQTIVILVSYLVILLQFDAAIR